MGTGGSGGSNNGGSAYTQTALLTFDQGAGVAPFAVAQTTAAAVTNLDADKLDGQHGSFYTDASNMASGLLPAARLTPIVNADISATAAIAYSKLNLATSIVNADVSGSAAIAWAKVSKTASSLADLTTRSAADLSSGTVAEARLGSGTGTVNKVLRGDSTWGDVPGVTTDGASRVQQIAFASTQSASADVNTLDDYEEGTWTPSIGGNTTYTSRAGTYTKIGNRVFITGNLVVTAIGTGSTTTVSGLPFAAAAVTTGSVNYFSTLASAVTWIGCYVSGSGTSLTMVGLTAAATSVTDPLTTFQNGTQVHFSMQYAV